MGGASWYRFFGAGEGMAQAAERGEWMPTILTFAIAATLAIWAAFAFSGAGKFPRLPLLRTGLIVIASIYLARALIFIPINWWRPQYSDSFAIWSSLIVLGYGAAYAIGTFQAWHHLAPDAPAASETKDSHARI